MLRCDLNVRLARHVQQLDLKLVFGQARGEGGEDEAIGNLSPFDVGPEMQLQAADILTRRFVGRLLAVLSLRVVHSRVLLF